jgi:hypothetical protein
MRRSSSDYVTCFTKKSAATESFFPITDFISTGEVASARMMIELLSRTPNTKIAAAYQTADVASSPNQAVTFGTFSTATYTTTIGQNVQDAFEALTTAIEDKLLIRFGFIVLNTTGTELEMALASGVVDVKDC